MSNDIDDLGERCGRAEDEIDVLRKVLWAVAKKLKMACPLDHKPRGFWPSECAWCRKDIEAKAIPKVKP
jgi:hypothetical protein